MPPALVSDAGAAGRLDWFMLDTVLFLFMLAARIEGTGQMLGLSPPPQPPGHRWQGASGRWYYFSISPLTAVPSWIGECNNIFARPRYDIAQSREQDSAIGTIAD
jgi:hypothetical protein